MIFPLLIIHLMFVEITAKGIRIIGGNTARVGQFPWQAAIYLDNDSGKYFCGGSLISNQWILTAAHCVDSNRVELFTIHLGSNTLMSPDINRILVASSTYVIHPEYNPNTLENDIGLIKLHMAIQFTEYIQKINIASTDEISPGALVTSIGFGQTSDTAAGVSNDLEYVQLSLISNTECQLIYGNQIKFGMVCATGNFNEGICIGDTGGSLVKLESNGNSLLVGIAIFMSQNGCESVDPSGFTRVDIYYEWISNITNTL